jgi:hypothetical protein
VTFIVTFVTERNQMKTNDLSLKYSNKLVLLGTALAFLPLLTIISPSYGQEKGSTETQAIKQIEESGGRVVNISAADNSREVSFYLSSKPIGDAQIAGLKSISNIIWLNLAGTEITDSGLQQISGLPLKKLHLERTKIGDEGLKHLKSASQLTYLNLYGTQVTDAGLEHIKSLPELKKLYVWKSKVTEAGIAAMQKTHPDLMIVGELKLKPVIIEPPKKPEAKKPEAKKPEAKKPEAKKPEAKKPEAKKPEAKKPEAKKPEAEKKKS